MSLASNQPSPPGPPTIIALLIIFLHLKKAKEQYEISEHSRRNTKL